MNNEYLLLNILKNQGMIIQLLSNMVTKSSQREEVYKYGQSVIDAVDKIWEEENEK